MSPRSPAAAQHEREADVKCLSAFPTRVYLQTWPSLLQCYSGLYARRCKPTMCFRGVVPPTPLFTDSARAHSIWGRSWNRAAIASCREVAPVGGTLL